METRGGGRKKRRGRKESVQVRILGGRGRLQLEGKEKKEKLEETLLSSSPIAPKNVFTDERGGGTTTKTRCVLKIGANKEEHHVIRYRW